MSQIPAPRAEFGTTPDGKPVLIRREWYLWLLQITGQQDAAQLADFFPGSAVQAAADARSALFMSHMAKAPSGTEQNKLSNDALLLAELPPSTAANKELDRRVADALLLASRPNPYLAQLLQRLSDLETMVAMLPRQQYAPISGFYTPTLANTTNLDASTAYECQYIRVRNCVMVSGKVDVDPTAPGSTVLGISLPFPSNIGAAEDCAGTAFASGIAGQGAAILGDATNNRAQMEWIAVDLTNQPMLFSFLYTVI